MKVLGIISGSSLDGLDMAICDFDSDDIGRLRHSVDRTETIEFDSDLYASLKRATSMNPREFYSLEVQFSRFCASAVKRICGSEINDVDYIASHGHTVFHHPEDGFTVQIGNGGIIAEQTGRPCITDFRMNDVALGGEGAPLAPIVEKYIYPGHEYYINLGGIANLSFHDDNKIVSLDTCPCNQALNHYSQQLGQPYDDKGSMARQGIVQENVLQELSSLPYFSLPHPKSMDNSWVQKVFIPYLDNFGLRPQDALATMVEFIGELLLKDVAKLNPFGNKDASAFVTGGGALNSFMIERIQHHFRKSNVQLVLPDDTTIHFKEAILMALMGYLRMMKIPNTLPSVTGAERPSIGGAVYWSQ